MKDDPILDEIHRFREEYAKRFNYDLNAICQDLRDQQQKNGHRVVTLPPRRPEGWTTSVMNDTTSNSVEPASRTVKTIVE